MDRKFVAAALGYAVLGLFLFCGAYVPQETIGPVLGVLSIITLTCLVLMKVIFIRSE